MREVDEQTRDIGHQLRVGHADLFKTRRRELVKQAPKWMPLWYWLWSLRLSMHILYLLYRIRYRLSL